MAGAANTSDQGTQERLATAVEILDRLVAFDTTSSRSNLALIDWVADYLDRYGIPHTRSSAGEGKANLYATIGPGERGGVLLSGHTDVVPVAGQQWTTDPFRLTERPDGVGAPSRLALGACERRDKDDEAGAEDEGEDETGDEHGLEHEREAGAGRGPLRLGARPPPPSHGLGRLA